MKQTKLILTGAILFIALFTVSCISKNNEYQTGLELGIVRKTENKTFVDMDSDNIFEIVEGNTSRLNNNARIIASFIIDHNVQKNPTDNSYPVRLYYWDSVRIVKIINVEEVTEETGNDPVVLLDSWISKNFINILFEIKGREYKKHSVSLVNLRQVADSTATFELRHNSHKDSPDFRGKKIISFPINEAFKKDFKKYSIKFKKDKNSEENRTFNVNPQRKKK